MSCIEFSGSIMAGMFLQTTQLRSELVACAEERDDLNQSLSQWREKVHSLEKTNSDTRGLISILEDDVRAGRKEYDGLRNSTDKLKTEKLQVRAREGSCFMQIKRKKHKLLHCRV